MQILYTIGIALYTFAIHCASIWNKKAKAIVQGRTMTLRIVKDWRSANPEEDIVWVHCASLGEYEQGKPVIDRLRNKGLSVALSFFSSSGYHHVTQDAAELIFFLPADLRALMEELVTSLQPQLYVMVKYDYWYNLLHVLQRASIPQMIISASFRPSSFFLKRGAGWYRNRLQAMNTIFCQTQQDIDLLVNHDFKNTMVSGDTRANRVQKLVDESFNDSLIEQLAEEYDKVVVYGSVWPDDLPIIDAYINEEVSTLHIVAPHDLGTIPVFEQTLREAVRRSDNTKSGVVLIDSVGQLKYLYRYADIAYVGGGVHNALHNTLEPAAYRVPIIYSGDAGSFYEVQALEALQLCTNAASGAGFYQAVEDFAILSNHLVDERFATFFNQVSADLDQLTTHIIKHTRS